MEKEILIQNLRDKVGEDNCKSISDKTFEAMADVYLPLFADDSAITEDTWKMPVAALVQFAGQKRHDEKAFAEDYVKQHQKDADEKVKKAVEDALAKYKAEHPEKPVEQGEEQKPAEDDIDAKIEKALAKLTGKDGEIGKLNDMLNKFISSQTEREKTDNKNRVKVALKKYLQELKADNEACIDDALNDFDYGEEPTFEGLKDAAKSAYEKRYKRYYSNGGKPFGGDSTGDSGDGQKTMIESHIKRVEDQVKDAQQYADSIKFAE